MWKRFKNDFSDSWSFRTREKLVAPCKRPINLHPTKYPAKIIASMFQGASFRGSREAPYSPTQELALNKAGSTCTAPPAWRIDSNRARFETLAPVEYFHSITGGVMPLIRAAAERNNMKSLLSSADINSDNSHRLFIHVRKFCVGVLTSGASSA